MGSKLTIKGLAKIQAITEGYAMDYLSIVNNTSFLWYDDDFGLKGPVCLNHKYTISTYTSC